MSKNTDDPFVHAQIVIILIILIIYKRHVSRLISLLCMQVWLTSSSVYYWHNTSTLLLSQGFEALSPFDINRYLFYILYIILCTYNKYTNILKCVCTYIVLLFRSFYCCEICVRIVSLFLGVLHMWRVV